MAVFLGISLSRVRVRMRHARVCSFVYGRITFNNASQAFDKR